MFLHRQVEVEAVETEKAEDKVEEKAPEAVEEVKEEAKAESSDAEAKEE